ncbi:MAG: hypothetical protein PHY12_00450 [Eubacteriales bacterium]|nr:hypothetical protein [Eubacteriales bacterium]
MKIKKLVSNLLHMVALPVLVYALLQGVCLLAGAQGFGVGSDLVVALRNAITTGCIALAVSYNLTSGRFDFSVGATLVLAVLLSGRLTLALGLTGLFGAIFQMLTTMLFGALLGALNGCVYVALRLPPMISSLGVCMLYEAVGYVFTAGSGVSIIGRNDLTIWAFSPYIYLLAAVILLALFVILNYTRFGYNTRSLQSGQEIAVNTGVNEKKNAVGCYFIAGALLGAAGLLNLCVYGKADPEISLSSISYIQNAFLPMFIGGALAKYGDRNLGVMMGAIVQSLIIAAFGRLGLSSSMQSILSGVIVIFFFAYNGNAYKLEEVKLFRRKREAALSGQAGANPQ